MKNILKTIIIALFISVIAQAALATEAKIAAVVNGNIITVNDVENRVKLYLQGKDSSKMPKQEIMRLTYQTLNELIDESIQTQEAQKFGIRAGDAQIDHGIEMIAKKSKGSAEDMLKSLKADGVEVSTLRDKIAAEISWSKLINRKLYSKVSISDEEIDMTIDKINNQDGKKYLVAEIMLLVPSASQESLVKTKIGEIIERIKQGVPFDALARQFSQAPGANKGGDLGWISENQIDIRLASALDNLKKGQISTPIRTAKGWHILLLRDVQEISNNETDEAKKDDADFRSNIASKLGTKRLNQMAIHYLNDLRAMALIEKRL